MLDPLALVWYYGDDCVLLLYGYSFTTITSGTAAPLGIFLPCIIIGCQHWTHIWKYCHLYVSWRSKHSPLELRNNRWPQLLLSGSTRMSYSLAVIMFRDYPQMLICSCLIIFSLFVSYGVGGLVYRGLICGDYES